MGKLGVESKWWEESGPGRGWMKRGLTEIDDIPIVR